MKKLALTFCLMISVLLGSVGMSSALPVCKGSPQTILKYEEVKSWSNCDGAITFAKSVGQSKGALIVDATPDGPAFKGGIRQGDVIVRFDDKDVKDMEDLLKIIPATTPNSVVNVEIVREGSPKTLSIKIGTPPKLGVMLQNINANAGKKYVGEFKNGMPNGQGTETLANGNKYVGEYKDGKKHGQGTLTKANGFKHVGEFKNGMPNGQGTSTGVDGTKWVAEFKDGIPNEQGTVTFTDGYKIETNKMEGNDRSSPQQIFLEKLISTTKASISENDNSAKKKRKWIKASRKLCSSAEFDVTSLKTNWVGYVDSILMRDNGSVRFEVSIDKHGNELQDSNLDDSLIDVVLELKESTLLKKGDFIKFSGYFKKGDMKENECLDAGIDSNPELVNEGFTFKFTKIEKINMNRANTLGLSLPNAEEEAACKSEARQACAKVSISCEILRNTFTHEKLLKGFVSDTAYGKKYKHTYDSCMARK